VKPKSGLFATSNASQTKKIEWVKEYDQLLPFSQLSLRRWKLSNEQPILDYCQKLKGKRIGYLHHLDLYSGNPNRVAEAWCRVVLESLSTFKRSWNQLVFNTQSKPFKYQLEKDISIHGTGNRDQLEEIFNNL